MAKRVLLIDDEPSVHELVAVFLEPAGYEIQSAFGGEEGLLLAANQVLDLILLDLGLPDMDGYAVCHALRKNRRTRRVPIVMVTGSDDPALTRTAYAAGAQACVLKPFRPEALIAVMRAAEAAIPRRNPEHGGSLDLKAREEGGME